MVIGEIFQWRRSGPWGLATAGGAWRSFRSPRRTSGQLALTTPTLYSAVRLVEQVMLIVGVFLMHLTCGQQLDVNGAKRYNEPGTDIALTQEDLRNLQEDQLTPYRVPKAVSVHDFSEVLKKANSYHDVLRVFYGSILTNEAIDNMMASHPQPKFYSSPFGRPRIGGLSDSMSFAMAAPNFQGIPSLMHSDAALTRASSSSLHRVRQRHRNRNMYTKIGRRQRRRQRRRGGNRKKNGMDHDAALKHYKEMETMAKCRLPVPVVLRIRDISNAASKVYFPPCTIVHRCRADAGCCNEASTCASSKNTTIQRSFFALEYVGNKLHPGKRIVETLNFINHTECACAPIQQIPECRECPFPFNLRRENKTDCTCDCFDRDHTCIHIKKGKSPLHEQELRLIKEGKRLRPKCQYGVFGQESIRTGYCPRRKSKQNRQPASEELVSGYGAAETARKRGNWG